MQKRRDCVPMDVDHLQVSQAVDATHAEAHHAENKRQTGQRFAQRNEHHADWHYCRVHQKYVVRINSESKTITHKYKNIQT